MLTESSSIIDAALDHTEARRLESPSTPATDAALAATAELTLAERENQARLRATAAGGILQRIIDQGKRNSVGAMERIMREAPSDMVVSGHGLSWQVSREESSIHRVAVTIHVADRPFTFHVHPHAFAQLAKRYDVPQRYLTKLFQHGEWSRELAESVLRTHAQHDRKNALVRTYKGTIRGVLSDSYRRIDSRPLLVAFAQAVKDCGMQIIDARASDVRIAVRAVYPEIVDIEGDPNLIGVEWTNSDYGAGKHEVNRFLLRTECLNGMTGTSIQSKVHLGARVSADTRLSKETLEHDTKALVGALGDVVRDAGSAPKRAQTIERVRAAAANRIELGDNLPTAVRRALSKEEQDRVRDLFNSAEAQMLPPAPTTVRLANAVSWMANTASNTDRALDLQRFAGELLGI